MSLPSMYGALAEWWPVLSPVEEWREDARLVRRVLREHAEREVTSCLELGCGGGHLASHLTDEWRMTLVDLAPGMLDVSRALNPGCRHVEADMRTVRNLGTFDAVLVQDAASYLTSADDVRAAARTAREHLAPGGATLFAPDHTLEGFRPSTDAGGGEADGRALRFLEWKFDPDPDDGRVTVAYAFLLRERDGSLWASHDEHELGVHSRALWLAALAEAGLRATAVPYAHSDFAGSEAPEAFVGVLPASASQV